MIIDLYNDWDSLSLAAKCMYVCFFYWAIGTAVFIGTQIAKPVSPRRKVNLHNPRDFVMISIILSWFAMWFFRSLV